VKVISIDPSGKIRLSRKALLAPEEGGEAGGEGGAAGGEGAPREHAPREHGGHDRPRGPRPGGGGRDRDRRR
jgi:polyribonucleotide nucleotidyltransferase